MPVPHPHRSHPSLTNWKEDFLLEKHTAHFALKVHRIVRRYIRAKTPFFAPAFRSSFQEVVLPFRGSHGSLLLPDRKTIHRFDGYTESRAFDTIMVANPPILLLERIQYTSNFLLSSSPLLKFPLNKLKNFFRSFRCIEDTKFSHRAIARNCFATPCNNASSRGRLHSSGRDLMRAIAVSGETHARKI